MKLAIVVVYMVAEDHGGLLDLHLDRIARHTSVPYTIHGSANRLAPEFRCVLASRPEVTLHDLEPTDLRGAAEHSWDLEQLVAHALADGATHVATLHVDSFPAGDRWAETLAGRAGGTFATIDGIGTACLLFPRTFHDRFRPRFQVADDIQKSAAFEAFVRDCRPTLHSGVGYAFAAYENGLRWYSMPVTAATGGPTGSFLYDDLVYHLQGAFRLAPREQEVNAALVERIGHRRFFGVVRMLRGATPAPLRRIARRLLRRPLAQVIDAPRERWMAARMGSEMEKLLADPDGYIEELRGS